MLAVRTPISAELRCRSQRAVGNRNDTQSISTASLAFAHPQMPNSSQWKSPNPADGHKHKHSKLQVCEHQHFYIH